MMIIKIPSSCCSSFDVVISPFSKLESVVLFSTYLFIILSEKIFNLWGLNTGDYNKSCLVMDHRVFQFATRGQCIKGKKLDCFEHNHVFWFKLQCASIVVLLGTAIWWKLKDAVVH